MPTVKRLTALQQFIKDKPPPEEAIGLSLAGERKENALYMVAWLRANGLPPRCSHSSPNQWVSMYRGKNICDVFIGHSTFARDDWRIKLKLAHMETYAQAIHRENLSGYIVGSTGYCVYSERSPYHGMKKAPGCGPRKPCRGGTSQTVLGQEVHHVCHYGEGFLNPGLEAIQNIGKLLTLEKTARAG